MWKWNTCEPNWWEPISQSIDIDNYLIEEYSFEIDKPEQVLKRSLRSIFVGGNISEISVNLVKDCYDELKKHDEYIQKIQHLQSWYNWLLITWTNYEAHFEVCIPILDIISMSSDLIEESDLDIEKKSELKQEYYTTFKNTITQWKLSAFFRNNSSPHREDFEELRIDDTFIRRLEIAAWKQKIKDILSWEHKYSSSSEELIDETRKKLSQLWFTHKDIDKHIKNNSKT